MRAAVMYDTDDIRIETRPIPALEPGDVLVRTEASGVCSGDLMPWYVRRKAPFVFGHEPAGTVVSIGGDAPARSRDGSPLTVGTRIFAHHHAPCFACAACARGAYVHCATWRSTALDPGGMAEFFRVPRANLADTLALPPGMSAPDGSLVEPLGCVVKSLRRSFFAQTGVPDAGSLAGQDLYVIGAGVMGLMHVLAASAAGARVFVSDFNQERLMLAVRCGAIAAVLPDDAAALLRSLPAGGPRVVMCGPGSVAALEHAVDIVAPDGTVLMFTPLEPEERFVFDQSRAYFRDIRLVASYSCGPDDTRAALALIARGVVTADKLGARQFKFPDVENAYDAMRKATVAKAIVTFDPLKDW